MRKAWMLVALVVLGLLVEGCGCQRVEEGPPPPRPRQEGR